MYLTKVKIFDSTTETEVNKYAIEEIYFALVKANGYFYDDVKKKLKEEFHYTFKGE